MKTIWMLILLLSGSKLVAQTAEEAEPYRYFRIYTDLTKIAESALTINSEEKTAKGELGIGFSPVKYFDIAAEAGYYSRSNPETYYLSEGSYYRAGINLNPAPTPLYLKPKLRNMFVPFIGYRYCWNNYAEKQDLVFYDDYWEKYSDTKLHSSKSLFWNEISSGMKVVLRTKYVSWTVTPMVKIKWFNKLDDEPYLVQYIPGYGEYKELLPEIVLQTGIEF